MILTICYTILDVVAELVQVPARKAGDAGSNPAHISWRYKNIWRID